jgi:hypothetical protein
MMGTMKIPFGGESQDRAIKLLAAAEQLDQDAAVVRTTTGGFLVEEDVAKKAGLDKYAEDSEVQSSEPEPVKKTAAKKTTAKKTAAKKTAAKKTAKKTTASKG